MRVFRISILEIVGLIVLVSLITFVTVYFNKPVSTVSKLQIKTVYIEVIPDETHAYLRALRLCEANGRYKINNGKNKHKGAYQIGDEARSDVGYAILNTDHGRELFQCDSILQEEIMLRLLQSQIRIMMPFLKKYNNTNIGNFWLTNSGILAMSHLAGPQSTINFLRTGIITYDGNKSPITRYLQFNNYHIPIDSVLLPNYINHHLVKYLQK